ncbi:MAG: sigma-70 family RNA polymerase sigma factor [Caldisericia bacterium]
MKPERVTEIAVQVSMGNNDSFAEIVEEYQDFVYNFSLRLTGNREWAWDLTSDVFMRVLAKLDKYSPEYPFKSWIGRVTYTLGLNFIRKNKRSVQLESLGGEINFEVPDKSETPDDATDRKITVDQINKAIHELKPDFKAIINICDIEEMSYKEAADILKIPLGTVRSRLFRARAELKEILNGTKRD